MTAAEFINFQEAFVVIFGAIIQWLLVGITMAATGLLVFVTGLTLLRRMVGTQFGERPNIET